MYTKTIKVDAQNIDESIIEKAAKVIKHGGLVAFPTETVYGLGADGMKKEAAAKIYEAKGRPSDNPLIIHIARKEDVFHLAKEVSEAALKLMEVFWPGPLTLIFEKQEEVPEETTGGLSTVAVRFPSHPVAQRLIEASGRFIAAPSANLSGKPSPTLAEHVIADLKGRVDMILDGGAVSIGIESTVLDVSGEVPVILRPGFITKEMLEDVVGEVKVDPGIQGDLTLDVKPKAPGMKYRHYAPKGELTIVEGNDIHMVAEEINSIVAVMESQGKKVGIIATDESAELYRQGKVLSIGSREDDATVAANLFKVLREFDDLGTEYIYSESFEGGKLGYAIMNRLLKAAGHRVVEVKGKDEVLEKNKIIFVCTTNSTRSYMAQMAMAKLLEEQNIEGIKVMSRGLVVLFEEPVNPKAQICLEAHGYPVKEYVTRQLTQEDIDSGCMILTMTEAEKKKVMEEYENVKRIYTIKEYANEQGEVLDPYGKEVVDYEYCLRELERLVEKTMIRLKGGKEG